MDRKLNFIILYFVHHQHLLSLVWHFLQQSLKIGPYLIRVHVTEVGSQSVARPELLLTHATPVIIIINIIIIIIISHTGRGRGPRPGPTWASSSRRPSTRSSWSPADSRSPVQCTLVLYCTVGHLPDQGRSEQGGILRRKFRYFEEKIQKKVGVLSRKLTIALKSTEYILYFTKLV